MIALASTVHGGVSAYQWAFVLMQFPYAVVAVSIYSSAFPRFALAAVQSSEEVTGTVMAASRRANVLPVGLALIARPAAVALVGPRGAALVAAALVGFAVSLLPFSLFQLLTRTSYAFKDTRSPALSQHRGRCGERGRRRPRRDLGPRRPGEAGRARARVRDVVRRGGVRSWAGGWPR